MTAIDYRAGFVAIALMTLLMLVEMVLFGWFGPREIAAIAVPSAAALGIAALLDRALNG